MNPTPPRRSKSQASQRVRPLVLVGALPPTEHFILEVPAKATLGLRLREIGQIQDALVEWIKLTAPLLSVVRLPGFIVPLHYITVPGVPFEVFLKRSVRGGRPSQLSVAHLVERNNLEENRLKRIRRAYEAKYPKLAAWQDAGARTVLIFEENDPQMTNISLVAQAIHEIEQTAQRKPNEIYLLSSAIDAFWLVYSLRHPKAN